MARETAFHPITSRTAAGYGDEAGWLWVTNFGDVDAEYRAIREGVGMWDLSPLSKWEFRGPEAKEAAQRVHTHDVMGAEPGQVRYGAFVDEDGLVVDDGTVFTFAEDHLWVCTNSDDRAEYFADATKGLDVSIAYIAPELPSAQP
jgi:glycine cleavage system aminomethyltransferase T